MNVENIEFDQDQVGDVIDIILQNRRLAFFGLSTDPRDFSHSVYQELLKNDFDVFPVNPKSTAEHSVKMYQSIFEVPEDVSDVYVLVNSEYVLSIVQDCHQKGVHRIWFHRGTGQGSINREALMYCIENGIEVVPGFCPFMFLESSMVLHKFHAWTLKLRKKLPITSN